MNNKLNILFICNKSPWPPHEGGPIAMNNLIKGVLAAGHNVKVLAISSNKYYTNPADIPESYTNQTNIELVYVDLGIKPIAAFLNLFTNNSYHIQRFTSNNFQDKLKEVLSMQNFDIVQIEMLFMSPYINTIRESSSASIVLRAHNIEHLIWKRVASITNNPLKRAYINHLARTLENYEKETLNKFDGIIPISSKDEEFFKKESNKPVRTISFGVNTNKIISTDSTKEEHALFHIGSMNWIPNEEGIKWFLDHVWPLVNHKLPNIKLYLAGREMPEWLKNLNKKNVVIVGEVPDAYSFIQSKTISIAPLFSGSGIRIKIIESMALGKAVISTTIGAEGINYNNGENIMIADDVDSFVKAIVELYNNVELCKRMGENASKLISDEHNNSKLIDRMVDFYMNIIEN